MNVAIPGSNWLVVIPRAPSWTIARFADGGRLRSKKEEVKIKNRANGISEIEGKATRVGASERGQ